MTSLIELNISDVEKISSFAKSILDFAKDTKLFLFYAPMGAGKTTLIKELCNQLGSKNHFSSPTYSIINEYEYPRGKIYHFDLYRLKSEEELLDLGIEEHLDSNNYCFFEWPEFVEGLISSSCVKIEITVNGNNRYLRASIN
ncbi:tRNA (adenosine(37)-N6)-threonylcarbamoyltransferase complex ATPase subunit type 1 TsaE [Aurantibacillus circumpalustris]|uniref:tRNA (adenosine(37)-N6)-threonylcarbamoyltransferase complex ATPase subunit type 1 TsaE n=1 Tax=Aurantibacillus circumpalustris TaxID=3036359 RepID=UPI00295A7EF5|nr:tRNA (adenosine(37)-N6)-threonylcarbamoyltransferase complex ATPase subunit type 1 TsaE [Aurantibacillus circumpalustris]